jgi:hypothetical protein
MLGFQDNHGSKNYDTITQITAKILHKMSGMKWLPLKMQLTITFLKLQQKKWKPLLNTLSGVSKKRAVEKLAQEDFTSPFFTSIMSIELSFK